MKNFDKIYRTILTEGRVPSIFRKATPEELAERRVKWGKVQVDEWMEDFLKRKDIRKNRDGSWDVDGTVSFNGMKAMTRFPIRFGKITYGNFYCSSCTGLTTLEGAPNTVAGGEFYCGYCTGLTTLEGAPKTVTGGSFSCGYCTGLTTLEGAPNTVTGGNFICVGCGRKFTVEEVKKHCYVEGGIFV